VADLVGRTRRCDRPADLVEFAGGTGLLFTRDGIGFAGRGVARRGSVEDITAALSGMVVDDDVVRPGSGPVAFGTVPFLPGEPGELVVPERVLVRSGEDGAWVTTIGPGDASGADGDGLGAGAPVAAVTEPLRPSRFDVMSSLPPADWCDAVAAATDRIRAGALDKVVLAREVVVTADEDIPIGPLLRRLRSSYAGCFLFSIDGFVGASPELLVSRHGDRVRAQPMAGTTARRGDPEADARASAALFSSASYRHEHQVTIDMVHDTLLRFSSYLDYEAEPSVVALANVAHLATTVEGRLSLPPVSVLDLVGALHPTPAVCGRPRRAALDLIAELEGLERGRYAGAVGWVDAAGNGQWAVGIRCAQIAGPTARVFAGNGIVADSDPATELAETRAKLAALLGAIVRP